MHPHEHGTAVDGRPGHARDHRAVAVQENLAHKEAFTAARAIGSRRKSAKRYETTMGGCERAVQTSALVGTLTP